MHYWLIRSYCKIYKSFVFSGSSLVVAHDKYVSIFSILSEKWDKHFAFEVKVKELFRTSELEIVVLFENNTLRVIKQKEEKHKGKDQETWEVVKGSLQTKLKKEKLISFNQDREDCKWILFITDRSKGKEPDFGIFAYFNL
jgi:hypothetical protein